jgi:hypothetical protein
MFCNTGIFPVNQLKHSRERFPCYKTFTGKIHVLQNIHGKDSRATKHLRERFPCYKTFTGKIPVLLIRNSFLNDSPIKMLPPHSQFQNHHLLNKYFGFLFDKMVFHNAYTQGYNANDVLVWKRYFQD